MEQIIFHFQKAFIKPFINHLLAMIYKGDSGLHASQVEAQP
ncbi:hypothetical protein [Amphritea sp.]